MSAEKKKFYIMFAVWIAVIILIGFVSWMIYVAPVDELKLVESGGRARTTTDTATVYCIEFKASGKVNSGYITVAFYDKDGICLKEERRKLHGGQSDYILSFNIVGLAVGHEITQCAMVPFENEFPIAFFSYAIHITMFAFIFTMLTIDCKEYDYKDSRIVAYAGRRHRYLRINGEIAAHYKSWVPFKRITLSAKLNDGTFINAHINIFNKIMLTIDGKIRRQLK